VGYNDNGDLVESNHKARAVMRIGDRRIVVARKIIVFDIHGMALPKFVGAAMTIAQLLVPPPQFGMRMTTNRCA